MHLVYSQFQILLVALYFTVTLNHIWKKLPVISKLLLTFQLNLDQYRSFKLPYIDYTNFSIIAIMNFSNLMIILQDCKHAFYKCLTGWMDGQAHA